MCCFGGLGKGKRESKLQFFGPELMPEEGTLRRSTTEKERVGERKVRESAPTMWKTKWCMTIMALRAWRICLGSLTLEETKTNPTPARREGSSFQDKVNRLERAPRMYHANTNSSRDICEFLCTQM